MTLSELQTAIDEWIGQFEEGYWSPLANLARLTEEVGELAREINHAHGPKTKKHGEDAGSIEAELSDIIITVATLANSLGIDLDRAVSNTIERVKVRDAERWARKS